MARLITPVLAAYTLKSDRIAPHTDGPIMTWYQRVLRWSTRHRWKTLGAGASWNDVGVAQLADAPSFRLERVKEVGPDLWMTYRPAGTGETHG